jgi:hypothetical protein
MSDIPPGVFRFVQNATNEIRHNDGRGEIADIVTQTFHQKNVIDHPSHYTSGGIEAIDVIEAFDLGFNLGNVVKYVLRSGRKSGDEPVESLRKAVWYLNREIERRSK